MRLEKDLIGRALFRGALLLATFAALSSLMSAETPSPALLITVKGDQGRVLAIADPRTSKVVARVPINGNPHQVTASSDGKFAFVTNSGFGKRPKQKPDDTIAVIDLASQKVPKLLEIGRGSFPHGIAFVGGKVYFTAEGAKVIGRYDPVADQIDWMQGTGHRGGHDLAVSQDLTKVFVPSYDPDAVAVIELSDTRPPSPYPGFSGSLDGPGPFWRITRIPVGRGPESLAMSPDGKEVWVLIRGDHGISIIDVATKKVSQTLPLRENEDPHRIAFTPDGKLALIANANGDVLIVDAAARKEIKRVNVADAPGLTDKLPGKETDTVLVEPNGSRAYVAVSDSNYVAILDLKKLELTGAISTGASPEGLAWAERN